MKEQPTTDLQNNELDPTNQCLNCGTQLNGEYCHNCGQHVTNHAMTVKQLIFGYLDNTYLWDTQQFKTIWKLISRPGVLTCEYVAGKFVSQVQPLKLNMFLLIVFLTLFVFFGSDQAINTTMQGLTNDEAMFAKIQLDDISEDETYLEKIKTSPRDTVNLIAPIILTKDHPSIIQSHQIIYSSEGNDIDQWIAIVPRVFIEEEIIKPDENGNYRFNTEVGMAAEDIALIRSIWEQLTSLIMQYLPIILLFTAPFLAFSLYVVQYKSKRNFFTHFVFSMHYIAFIELMMIVIYVFYLILDPSLALLNMIFTTFSCIYFARSFHTVYETSWFRSITKAILANVIYYSICFLTLIVLLFIACIIVAAQSESLF
ncbi:MAG: DUF3667 domain-containing protein [Muribaculaceae bacterium]|nr:DUF3667 domain-containing protein [Muribaculaceae bacterium]